MSVSIVRYNNVRTNNQGGRNFSIYNPKKSKKNSSESFFLTDNLSWMKFKGFHFLFLPANYLRKILRNLNAI